MVDVARTLTVLAPTASPNGIPKKSTENWSEDYPASEPHEAPEESRADGDDEERENEHENQHRLRPRGVRGGGSHAQCPHSSERANSCIRHYPDTAGEDAGRSHD